MFLILSIVEGFFAAGVALAAGETFAAFFAAASCSALSLTAFSSA